MDQQYENKTKAALNAQKPRINTQCDTQSNYTSDQMDMKFDLSDNNTHYQNQKSQCQSTSNLILKEIKKYARIQECMDKVSKIQIRQQENDQNNGRQYTPAIDALQEIIGQVYDKAVTDNSSGSRNKTPHQEEIKSESQNTKHSVRYQQYGEDQNNNNDYKRQGNLFSTSSQIEHISQMSQKQPSSPVQSQFNHSEPNRFQGVSDSSATADSEAFKENLKLILGTLVDQIWKQKASQPNVIYINQKNGQTNKTPTQSQQNANKVVQISKTARNRYKNSFESVENIEDFANDHITKMIAQDQCESQQMTISFQAQQYQDQDPLDVNTSLTESQKIRSKSMQKRCTGEYQKLQQQNLKRSTKKMPIYGIELRESSELLNNEKLALRQERSENQPQPQTLLKAENNTECYIVPLPFQQNTSTTPVPGSGQPGGQDYSFYNSDKQNPNRPNNTVDSILSQNQQTLIEEIQQSSSHQQKEEERNINNDTFNLNQCHGLNNQEVQEIPQQVAQQMEGPQQYFREMPTTQRLHSANNVAGDVVMMNQALESPDAKNSEIIRPDDINPSSTKKKNMLNESSDEEDNQRRHAEYNREQIQQHYERVKQGCLDDSSSSSYSNEDHGFGIEDENAQFRFAEKLNNFNQQNESSNPTNAELGDEMDRQHRNEDLQKSIDAKMQQQQSVQQDQQEEEEDDEEEEEYERIQPDFMQMIKNENNKNTYRWDVEQTGNPNQTKSNYDNIFSELTIEESDEDPSHLDKQRNIAALALGRNESSEKKQPPKEIMEEPEHQVEEVEEQYEQQKEDPNIAYEEENQIERVEHQDHYPSGYINQLCHNKEFEVIEEVEAENKEYSDDANSAGELSFERKNKHNQTQDLLDFERQDDNNADIQSAKTCQGNQYFDLLESKIEEKMKELLHKNASVQSKAEEQNQNRESMEANNSMTNPLDVEEIKLGEKQTKMFLTDNNPIIQLESEEGEDEAPAVSLHHSSPSKISLEHNTSKEEKLKRIIQMKNEFKRSQISQPRQSLDESIKGSVTSRNSKEKASGNSIGMSMERLNGMLDESNLSNNSLPKQEQFKRLSASKTERFHTQGCSIQKEGSPDKVRVLGESPKITMNPRANGQQADLLFSSGISKLSEVSFIKDSIIQNKKSVLNTKDSVKQNNMIQQIINQAVTPNLNKTQDLLDKTQQIDEIEQKIKEDKRSPKNYLELKQPPYPQIDVTSVEQLTTPSTVASVPQSAILRKNEVNLSFESSVSKISRISQISKESKSSDISRISKTSKSSSKGLKAPTSVAKSAKTTRKSTTAIKDGSGGKLSRSSSGLLLGSGSQQAKHLQSSMVSSQSTGSINEPLRHSIGAFNDLDQQLHSKTPNSGDKGFLRSGFSAITSSLSRRLSYQPQQVKSHKQQRITPPSNNVQQDQPKINAKLTNSNK